MSLYVSYLKVPNVANILSAVPLCLNIYPGDGASTDEGFLEWVLSLFIAQMRLIIENEMAINLRLLAH